LKQFNHFIIIEIEGKSQAAKNTVVVHAESFSKDRKSIEMNVEILIEFALSYHQYLKL
jgi:hypothetical protein